ncbi:MAG: flagellar hook-length control protein FliK [Sulfurimonas sp.]|nr:MAG: flagellar hook-length control protein FliK [Sulfurimonas sp.]
MISLESKTQTSATSSPLNIAPKEEDPKAALSFSELLRGVSEKKDDKIIQNGALVLALDEEVSADTKASSIKATTLLELLKGEQKEASKLPLELNPEATKDLTHKEIKVLIKDAKEYLKNKIISSEGFKKVEIENLPKTLKGLVQVAKKFGIDIGKVTLEEVKQSTVVLSQQVKVEQVLKEIKDTRLFKAQSIKEITTEQLVNTKIGTLRATRDVSKSLETLLRGETKESTQNQKLDGLSIAKADSFEIKLNEAKQMTKYLSADVKTAIEDYKSPFTRIKVALNPQRLGSVELTVIQRGKNLHINISSNNAAINALALNANDLKVQLNNSGINNASLNFNNNSPSSEQGSFGQQQRNFQNEKEAKDEYNYFGNEEKNEEILNSLEIVVPHYA